MPSPASAASSSPWKSATLRDRSSIARASPLSVTIRSRCSMKSKSIWKAPFACGIVSVVRPRGVT